MQFIIHMVGTKLLSCYFALFVLTCQYFAGGSHVGRGKPMLEAIGAQTTALLMYQVPGTRHIWCWNCSWFLDRLSLREAPFLKVAHVYWHCPNSFQPPPTLCQTGTVGHFFRTLLFFSDGSHGIRKHLGCGFVEPDFTYIGMRKTALWTSNRLNPLRTNSWLLSPNREKKRAVGCLAGRKGSPDDSAVTCSLAQFGSQPPDLRKQLQGSTLFWLFWVGHKILQ